MSTGKKWLLGIGVAIVVGAIAVLTAGDAGPDAGQQEKALVRCLERAGFTTKSEIPPYSRGDQSPEHEVEVRSDGEAIAYVYLFDFAESAAAFVEEARLDAETEDEKSTIKQRGPAAVDLDPGASTTPKIRACVDRAAKPPSGKA